MEELRTSMLADNDTASVCANVRNLTVDIPCANLSRRFPNIHTLTILPASDLSRDDCAGFRRLRRLTTVNIDMIPSPAVCRIRTLTLFETNNLLEHPTIYPNVQHLTLENGSINSLTIVTAVVQHFPNLCSLEIQLLPNAEYYDCLDVLLDGEHLPHLSSFKTNWIDYDTHYSNIRTWITANTPLKWKSTPFYGHRDDDCLTICL
jgi:hypothetical protein